MKSPLLFSALLLAFAPTAWADPVSLFDGKTLEGWESTEMDQWRVEGGAIVAGDLKSKIPNNFFLFTKKNYADFEFRCQFRLTGDATTGMINSGIQFRSEHRPDGHASGYQADIGDPQWWGCIYDEHRRNQVIAQSDMAKVGPVVKRNDWNEYVIRCEGARSRLWINGVLTVDYMEPDAAIARSGKIAVQVHAGGAAKVEFKDLTIEEFERKESPLRPEEEKQTFVVPEGYEVELVASEETGLPKPITVQFDDAGRMWSITATEYPVDGNETPEQSMELWKSGGQDRVVVFDDPLKAGPQTPRTFADGLAMPMGLLPWKDGAIVGLGPEIVFLGDADGDGKADSREVLVKGFGVQDSHLMPHQFTMMPGGWVGMAQGAFNRSAVVAGGKEPVSFDYCKLGRFRPDGSEFEVIGYGLNNIWGFVLNRQGEMFIQEANDMNYSVVPFQVGSSYPGIGSQKFKPYAPFAPPVADYTMGGTGLSGLALSEDRSGGFPEPWRDVMFVANPITRTINAVKVTGIEGGGYKMERLPDFLGSSDEWFRPIAISFGPDGCLYIVDWYNKIISHNEVPRKHPDRDKTRGRIWRVRHSSQQDRTAPNIAKLPDAQLVEQLKSDSTWALRAAWRQIVFRQAKGLTPQLQALARDRSATADARIHALWSLEGLGLADAELIAAMTASDDRNIRREAAALSASAALAEDADPQVRAQAIRTLSRGGSLGDLIAFAKPELNPETGLVLEGKAAWGGRLGKPLPAGPAYDRAFERYLVRAALERLPEKLAAFLDGPEAAQLPAENRLFASLALPAELATPRFVRAWTEIKRDPNDEELLLLIKGHSDPTLQPVVAGLFSDPEKAPGLLSAALRLRDRLGSEDLRALFTPAARTLDDGALLAEVAATFRLEGVKDILLERIRVNAADPVKQAGLINALGRIGAGGDPVVVALAMDKKLALPARRAAVVAIGASGNGSGADIVHSVLAELPAEACPGLLDDLSGSAAGSRVILKGIEGGRIDTELLTPGALERMHTLLEKDAGMKALWARMAGRFPRALRLGGNGDDFVASDLVLDGPFTVEAWVRLNEGIANADGVLGRPGGMDMNFFDGKFRVFGGPEVADVVVATKSMVPGSWTHVAVTRDDANECAIYINGELDARGTKKLPGRFEHLNVGQTTPAAGTSGDLMEVRVWNIARGASAIRRDFFRRIDPTEKPRGLVYRFPSGSDSDATLVRGKARIEGLTDAPQLLSSEEALAQSVRLEHFKTLAAKDGDVKSGEATFNGVCLSCHTLGGKGAGAAPALDGSGHRDLESLLTALLNPNAAVEAGYRAFRVETHDGRLMEGFLVKQDTEGVTLKIMGGVEFHFPSGEIRRAGFTNRSFMAPGLLDALADQQATDLLLYIASLRDDRAVVQTEVKQVKATEAEATRAPFGRQVSADGISHSFLVTGGRTALIGEDSTILWETSEASRDGSVLPSGNILIAHANAAREYARDGKVVWEYKLSPENGELERATRFENGVTMIVELGKKPRILEVGAKGEILSETPLQPETDNTHMQTRMVRKLSNGNYLAPHLLAFAVKEYDPTGKIVRVIPTDLEELGGRAAENWPFTAIRLENGNTLVNLTHGNKSVEFDPEGKVVWQVDNTTNPGLFADPCGAQRLPNGNTIICSYGQKDASKPRIFEVTPDKKVVWEFYHDSVGAHEVHVITTNGEALSGEPLK
jgi:putative membrane-bound dehydrogenase-like protein